MLPPQGSQCLPSRDGSTSPRVLTLAGGGYSAASCNTISALALRCRASESDKLLLLLSRRDIKETVIHPAGSNPRRSGSCTRLSLHATSCDSAKDSGSCMRTWLPCFLFRLAFSLWWRWVGRLRQSPFPLSGNVTVLPAPRVPNSGFLRVEDGWLGMFLFSAAGGLMIAF
jgi:hypothetical protein